MSAKLSTAQIIDVACAVTCDKKARNAVSITQLIALNAITLDINGTPATIQASWDAAAIDDVKLAELKVIVNR